MLVCIQPFPRQSGIVGKEQSPAGLPVRGPAGQLEGVRNEYFIRVARIDENAGEVTKRKIATTAHPLLAAIAGYEQRLFRADVDQIRSLRILNDYVDGRSCRNAADLLPRFTRI